MKIFYKLFFLCLIVIIGFPNLAKSQLSGIYTINFNYATGGRNFTNFVDAANSLMTNGVSGPVTFNMVPSTYGAAITITAITGSSTSNSVVFQANAPGVIISQGANPTVGFTGTDNFKFVGITFQNTAGVAAVCVLFTCTANAVNNIAFENCNFIGRNIATLTAANAVISKIGTIFDNTKPGITFKNCKILQGSRGVDIVGGFEKGWEFRNCYLAGWAGYGINATNLDGILIEDCSITSRTTAATEYGINIATSRGDIKIQRNKIRSKATTTGYGIYLNSNLGTGAVPNLITNNMVTMATAPTNYGIFVNLCTFNYLYHNSVNCVGGAAATSFACNLVMNHNQHNYNVRNNIFANNSSGYALRKDNFPVAACDYNDLYSNGTNVAQNGVTNYTTIPLWNGATGLDANSIKIIPAFLSDEQLYPSNNMLDNRGTNLLATVPADIDGKTRTSTPDMGAVEDVITLHKPWNALSFCCNSKYVTVPNNAAINFTNTFTAEAWVRTNYGADQKVIGKQTGTTGWVVSIRANKFVTDIWDAGGTPFTIFSEPILSGQLYHIAVTWQTGGSINQYINGVLTATIPASASNMSATAANMGIGIWTQDFASWGFSGEIDEVRLWNVVRTPTQIYQNAFNRLNGNEAGLVAYYNFDRTNSTVLSDLGPNRLNGTLSAGFNTQTDWVTSQAMSPTIKNVDNIQQNSLNFYWDNVYNVTNYYYYFSDDGTFASNLASGTIGPGITSFNLTGLNLTEGTTYYLMMKCDIGAWSSPNSGTYIINYQHPLGNCMSLNGTNQDLILAGNYTSITNQITVEFWEYSTRISDQPTTWIQGVDAANTRFFNCQIWSDQNLYFDAGNPYNRINKYYLMSDFSNGWNHWALVKNATSGNMWIYRNGQLYHSGAGMNNTFAGNIKKFSIGSSGFGNEYFQGKFDEVRIWNYARSQGEIQADMNKYITPAHSNYANLVEYYRFDQGRDAGNNAALSRELISYSNTCSVATLSNFTYNGSVGNWVSTGREGAPILTTYSVNYITGSASIVGEIFSTGSSASANMLGACWSTSPCPTLYTGSMGFAGSYGTGVFTTNITGITTGSTYYVRAFAQNADGITYGETKTFTTPIQPLFGVYSINLGIPTNFPNGRNFQSFAAATSALTNNGIIGPCTFNVISGYYNEQVAISQISGSSSANFITFQSITNNPQDVSITFNPTVTDAIFRNYGCSNLGIKNMTLQTLTNTGTFGAVIMVDATTNSMSNILIEGNIIIGRNTSLITTLASPIQQYTNTLNKMYNATISNNKIYYGSQGIVIGNGSLIPSPTGNKILNNTISGFANGGIFCYGQNAVQIHGNTVLDSNGSTNSSWGIYITQSTGSCGVFGNRIVASSSFQNYGIMLYSCNIPANSPALVYNNMVSILNGNGINEGIILWITRNTKVYHNTVLLTSGSAGSMCADVLTPPINAANQFINNIFVHRGIGYAIKLDLSVAKSVASCDFNVLYTAGVNVSNNYTTNYTTLPTWSAASNFDKSSFSFNVPFVSPTDLHINVCGFNFGKPIGISIDYDNVSRSLAQPNIGAEEVSGWSPLSGVYSIDKAMMTAGRNFGSFSSAVNAMLCSGISGPVTFNVFPGNYFEQLRIPKITGTSAINSIAFQGYYYGIPKPKITFTPIVENYVVRLYGVNNILFKNLQISNVHPSSTTNNGRVIDINNGSGNIWFDDCSITGIANKFYENANYVLAVIYHLSVATATADMHNLKVTNCNITGGSHSFYINPFTDSKNNILYNNKITDFSTKGIWGLKWRDFNISNNNIRDRSGSTVSIYGVKLDNGLSVNQSCIFEKNMIDVSVTSGGFTCAFHCNNTNGTATYPVVIRNNFFLNRGIGTQPSGLYISSPVEVRVYHNTIKQTSPGTTYAALYASPNAGSKLQILNNIIVNTGGYLALDIDVPANAASCDYNLLYSSGVNVCQGTAGANYTTLAAWRTASNFDKGSISVSPAFVSTTDLHLTTAPPSFTMKNVLNTIDDIDGDTRGIVNSGIGADEQMQGVCGLISINTTWSGTVDVICDVTVSLGVTLTIAPGTIVRMKTGNDFNWATHNATMLHIQGRLDAQGTAASPIRFTRLETTGYWGNIVFYNGASNASLLKFVTVEYANCMFSVPTMGLANGAITSDGVAFQMENCNVVNNFKSGLYLMNGANCNIINTNISKNANHGAEIYIANPNFYDCAVNDNTAGYGFYLNTTNTKIINATIANNNFGMRLFGGATLKLQNSIVWGNTNMQIDAGASTPTVSYCDIQGGYTGHNNINVDPLFTNIAVGNYTLQNISPCINVGYPNTDVALFSFDIFGNQRILFCRIDLGALESTAFSIVGYDVIWTGCVDENWHNTSNWNTNSVPLSTQNVYIQGLDKVAYLPKIFSANGACKNIYLNTSTGAKVTINQGFKLFTN